MSTGDTAGCVFGIPSNAILVYELNDMLHFTIECDSPTSETCRCTGRDCAKIRRVEALSWAEGRRLIRAQRGVLVSSHRCCACGLYTRAWLLSDGSILFTHDWPPTSGAHRVVFLYPVASKLRKLWDRLVSTSSNTMSASLLVAEWLTRILSGADNPPLSYDTLINAVDELGDLRITRVAGGRRGPKLVTITKQDSVFTATTDEVTLTLSSARIVVVAPTHGLYLQAELTPELLATLQDTVDAVAAGDAIAAFVSTAEATRRTMLVDADSQLILLWDGERAVATSIAGGQRVEERDPASLAKRLMHYK